MGKIAFVFAGQGAQHSGMGLELSRHSAAAKAVYAAADRLRPGTSEQCFFGSDEMLQKTENTQPCLYCVDVASACALREAGIVPDMAAGFSLGELAALTFAGAFSIEDGFALVCQRGKLMQQAAEMTDAAMTAVLKLSDETVIRLCSQFAQVYPVNFNSQGQVVVSGRQNDLALLKEAVKAEKGRTVDLKVGGGFHSPFMAPAAEKFAEELKNYVFSPLSIPVYANKTAQPYPAEGKELLASQIQSPVLWKDTVLRMIADGADTFIEVGAGNTLAGLIRRISKDVRVYSVETPEQFQTVTAEVQANA